jgi:tRNA(Ile)-lysidine synthase
VSLHASVRRTLNRHGLLPSGTRVAVALSGGADSVALLLVLRELAAEEGFHLAGAAHLNHQLRGAGADADAEFCRALASKLDVPFFTEQVDVAAIARDTGCSVEHAAHEERHRFFDRAASALGASVIAVGHTKNDQAETFLLRLLRGAGPRGLGGMHPRSGSVVRPLLDTTRADVRAFLSERGASFCEDPTNADVAIPRNRIRHELLPLLERRFSPAIGEVLNREAAIARDDADCLDRAAGEVARRLVSLTVDRAEISIDSLLAEHPAIVRRVLRLAQHGVTRGKFVGFDAAETVLAFMVSKQKGPLDLPGHRVSRRGNLLVLTKRPGRAAESECRDFSYTLEVPGAVEVPEASCAISAEKGTLPAASKGTGDLAVIDSQVILAPLAVRNRRPGDRLRPLGLAGRKKLQDLFVDKKVDRAERDTIPVVVDAGGRIVWVPGHALAEEFRVTERTEAVVILKRLPS